MAKKKGVKKKAAKKRTVKKSSRKMSTSMTMSKKVRSTKRKIILVARNLILFIILALLSFLLSIVSGGQIYRDFFSLLTWILGFVAVAFLIAFLILLILKSLKK